MLHFITLYAYRPIVLFRVRRNSRNRGSRDFGYFGSLPRFLTNAATSQRGREFVRLSKN